MGIFVGTTAALAAAFGIFWWLDKRTIGVSKPLAIFRGTTGSNNVPKFR